MFGIESGNAALIDAPLTNAKSRADEDSQK
jgi:hypothetical protein